ncbi:MAG TPA: hypothetical protein VHT04_17740 [Stellaceae bacterium]|jgi:hypothetical protein|nr:hypothetical protein [Stellaceae bacterium]
MELFGFFNMTIRAQCENLIPKYIDRLDTQRNGNRACALPAVASSISSAAASSSKDRQAQLGDRRLQVAVDIDGERLERRDI